MYKKVQIFHYLAGIIFLLAIATGCSNFFSNELIVNRYADALLTKNNELQFRFLVNSKLLEGQPLYKVKITIHNPKLAEAIGKNEIIYGEDQVFKGEYLDAKEESEKYIFMAPIPLKKDFHVLELKNMIENEHAVSIEIFNDQEVFGRAFLNNFSSEL
ncbi:MAG: hypothetical protein Q8934_15940 [Bacillota bacterium]|nr:hypothetical protein [Bacillota bacterium]